MPDILKYPGNPNYDGRYTNMWREIPYIPPIACRLTSGYTFMDRSPVNMESMSAIGFDASTGVWMVSGNKYTYISTNRETWTEVTHPTYNGNKVFARDIVSDGNGTFILGGTDPFTATTAILFKTTDNGLTWKQVAVATYGTLFDNLAYANGTYISVSSSTVHRSTDGGESWNLITDSILTAHSVATNGKGFWCANYQNQSYSEDDGLTWISEARNVSANLFDMYYDKTSGLWLGVGTLASILTSTDGRNWTVRQATGELNGALNYRHITKHSAGYIASGDGGQYQRSLDGITWSPIETLGGAVELTVGGNENGCLIATNQNNTDSKIWEAVG